MTENEVSTEKQEKPDLPGHWKQVQTAIWLIGLAILAWQGWWWPGILVLVAISGLTEAAIHWYAGKQAAKATAEASAQAEQKAIARARTENLPATCPNCGSPISEETVVWKGAASGVCPFCGSAVTGASSAGNGEPASMSE